MSPRIKRIDHIRGFGSFRDWECDTGIPEFKRYNLIYGWNGSGKTTLSRLFRSIETGHSHEIADDGVLAYQLTLDDDRTVDADASEQLGPLLRVFNQDYVEENLRFDEQARANPLLVLGRDRLNLSDNITEAKASERRLREQVVELSEESERLEKDLSDKLAAEARILKLTLSKSPNDSYANYNQARFKSTLDTLSDSTSELLNDRDKKGYLVDLAATRLGTVRTPPPVDLVAMNEAVASALERLAESTPGSDSLESTEDAVLIGWLSDGVKLHPIDAATCRFCTSTIPNGRLAELHERFSGSYREFVDGLDAAHRTLSSWDKRIGAFMDAIADIDESNLYENLREDWSTAARRAKLAAECVRAAIQIVDNATIARLENPHELVAAPIVFEPFTLLSDVLGDSATSVREILRRKTDQEGRIDENRKRAQLKLERDAGSRFKDEYLRWLEQIGETGARIEERRGDLANTRLKILELERQASSQIKAVEMLNDAIGLYFGRGFLSAEPVVNDGVDVGLQLRRSGEIATHLSEGERKGIALTYFLIEVNDALERGEHLIVVLDDPVSSLDDNGLFQAESLVRRLGVAADQLFVLTHNFTFFRRVRRWMKSGKRSKKSRLLYLTTRDVDGIRVPLLRNLPKLLRNHESDYQYLFAVVGAASERLEPALPESELAQAPNASRRLLETFLGFRCPSSTDFKGGLLELKTQQSEVFRDVDIDALAAFLDEGSHEQSMDTASTSLLASYLDRRRYDDVMRIIERADPQHYAAMINVCLKNGFSNSDTA